MKKTRKKSNNQELKIIRDLLNHPNFSEVKVILKKQKLEAFEEQIIMFLAKAIDEINLAQWAGENNPGLDYLKANAEEADLRDFLSKTKTINKEEGKLVVNEIVINTKTFPGVKVKSKFLTMDLISLIEKHLLSKPFEKLDRQQYNINSRRYFRDAILSLKPFVKYLEAETITWKSKNSIYWFIISLLEIFIKDIDLSATQIKDVLKSEH